MPELIAIARLLLSPLLLLLSSCGVDGISYSNRIVDNGHDRLYSKAHVKDGIARFECKASEKGSCHYTLYPDACGGKADCELAPLRQFAIARGHAREFKGLPDFRVCVDADGAAVGPDCKPRATVAKR